MNPVSIKTKPGNFGRFLARSLLALSGATLLAQAAKPPVPASVAQEDPIALSAFRDLEEETGWSANDTLTGTRTKQALKDLPVNIDAITADFMEDLGLFNATRRRSSWPMFSRCP